MLKNKERLIEILNNCADACDHCVSESLKEKDLEKMEACLRSSMNCADLCHTTARLVNREWKGLESILSACQETCRLCADECAEHDMEHCRKCEDACRQCAVECEDAHAELVV